ncbi:uncharacterized protein LOC115632722 [Scaptodrosophila lebanonensis]|uniref:Uncharacterized protein LOC115632722 n=1 Tax=Drosophila lebanonensis TaxID=7225 RepID=A0A6J2UEI2_DROLE|nr:uncharacterized protein LOC115632722 [Scaptodrosophila lebanonensis]
MQFHAAENFGHVELKPNGTLILRHTPELKGSNRQNLLLLRSVLNALRWAPLLMPGQPKLDIKIYGDGVEHKFPPVLENILQRIQTYFSIYRYTDTSRPKDEAVQPQSLEDTTTVKVNDVGENKKNAAGGEK